MDGGSFERAAGLAVVAMDERARRKDKHKSLTEQTKPVTRERPESRCARTFLPFFGPPVVVTQSPTWTRESEAG